MTCKNPNCQREFKPLSPYNKYCSKCHRGLTTLRRMVTRDSARKKVHRSKAG